MTITEIFNNQNFKAYFDLSAKFQQKKNAVRKELASRGILEKGGYNQFDKYKYFSEAQYKELFTELFSKHGLELTVSEVAREEVAASEKMPFGRVVTLEFRLTDVETGFFETALASGEGFDKGDKGIYKAYTGALKYYLANNFMVATGDDPEKDEQKEDKKEEKKVVKYATPTQVEIIAKAYTGESLKKLLAWAKVTKLEELTLEAASGIIKKLEERKNDTKRE